MWIPFTLSLGTIHQRRSTKKLRLGPPPLPLSNIVCLEDIPHPPSMGGRPDRIACKCPKLKVFCNPDVCVWGKGFIRLWYRLRNYKTVCISGRLVDHPPAVCGRLHWSPFFSTGCLWWMAPTWNHPGRCHSRKPNQPILDPTCLFFVVYPSDKSSPGSSPHPSPSAQQIIFIMFRSIKFRKMKILIVES